MPFTQEVDKTSHPVTISIITIVRNDRDGISRTLWSVMEQSARDSIEYIVIDGVSTDGTRTDFVHI